MSTQSYPWYRFAHVEYLLNPVITGLSLSAQGANTRLMAYAARELPFGTLPNNEKDLITMSGAKSVKEYQKILSELMDRVWFVSDDRLFCPLMNIESLTVTAKEQSQQDEQAERLSDAERARRYRENKKNRGGDDNESSRTVIDTDRDASHDSHDTVTQESDTVTTPSHDRHDDAVTLRDEMGGRGEDLDSELKQDLDKEQEVKTKTPRGASVSDARFDEFWIQYPRKENKQGALKAWKKLKPSESLYQQIILAVATQKTWPSWMSGYAPHAMTWLNGSRWDDQQANIIPMPNKPKQMTDAERKAAHDQMTREAKRIVFGDSDDDFIDGVASHV